MADETPNRGYGGELKNIMDEIDKRAIQRLHSIVIENGGVVEWNQLPKDLRAYLTANGFSNITIDENFIAKILHSLWEKGTHNKNCLKENFRLSENLQKSSEVSAGVSDINGEFLKNQTEKGAIGKLFTELLYNNQGDTYVQYNKVFTTQKARYLAYVPAVFMIYGNEFRTKNEILKLFKELYELAEGKPCSSKMLERVESTWFGSGDNAKYLQELYFEARLASIGSGLGMKEWVYRLDNTTYLLLEQLYLQARAKLTENKKEKELIEKWELLKKNKKESPLMDRVEMVERFVEFFNKYVDDGKNKTYIKQLEDLLFVKGGRSLKIDFQHLQAFDPELAENVLDHPEIAIDAAEEAIQLIVLDMIGENKLFHARFYNLPKTILPKQIGSEHINKLIQIEGIVSRISEIKPFVAKAVYVCKDCGHEMGRLQKSYGSLKKVTKCEACGSKNVEMDKEASVFIDFQHMRIQDAPEKLKGGQMPRFIDAVVIDDLVESVLPGDRLIVTGILRVVEEQGEKRPILRKILEVNHIQHLSKDIEDIELTEKDKLKIREEAKKKDFVKKFVRSIAPSIYGMEKVKLGIALALIGGVSKVLPDGTRVRGESHILLVGDPGIAKSHLLMYTKNLAPRAIYTTGKGMSNAGLTAAAVRDEFTGNWVLEAGVLVLADKGLALIDEFDKMNERDRAAIHEAMEQNTVSVAKAGITATMNARTTVIAAANPKYGRFNRQMPITDQIELGPTLLSRFDLIFPLFDIPNPKDDANLAEHVLNREGRGFEAYKDIYEPEFIRKYVAYAKKYVKPKLSPEAKELLKEYYIKLRGRSKEVEGFLKVPITARQLEALIRLTEAHARMRLSEVATEEDAQAAIDLMEYAYGQLLKQDEDFDANVLAVGYSAEELAKMKKVEQIIRDLQYLYDEGARFEDIKEEAQRVGIETDELKIILERLIAQGVIHQYGKSYRIV